MPRRKLEDIPVRPIPTDPSAMLTEIDVARMTGLSRQTLADLPPCSIPKSIGDSVLVLAAAGLTAA
jgi:hypothetical protein